METLTRLSLFIFSVGFVTSCQDIDASIIHERYFLQEDGERLVHFHTDANSVYRCREFVNAKNIAGALSYIKENIIRKVTPSAMKDVLKVCEAMERDHYEHIVVYGNDSRSFTFPGTKWCGPGNTANDYDDLGEHWETDMCCRKHDHCPDSISSGKEKHGLANTNVGAVSLCSCDKEFHRCLRATEHCVSDKIGTIFFNLLAIPCFAFEHPIVDCARWGGFGNTECQEYILDESKPEIWQFFDPQEYKNACAENIQI